ncbi:hypothetical protein [Cryobacterium roopkundense]|uniref:Uncharacterized protein n=1 Tax=Cryobacterium roopkundense TaxID=1001240 RepID=A0A7W8ZTB2_9MICO|nr:hypothetical protein [Cryobacterium roopkundense]MBB5639791.1 hypothetical protein [Cryobacterium roopkundense]
MESDRNPTGAGGFYAPAPPDADTYTQLGTVTVDGETFFVRTRDNDGSTHYDWISGPNDGYGFSESGGRGPRSPERHVDAIRDFLAGIDPATGYLSDP